MTATTSPADVVGGERLGEGRLLGELDPGTPAWTTARAARIGGSEIAAVLGLSPFESYFGLWHRKVGNLGGIEDTVSLRMGRRMEDDIADEVVYQHPELELVNCPTYVHHERDWQLISPDRIAINRETGSWIPLEIKHPYGSEEWGPTGSDEIPVYYRCQVMQAMDVLGVREHLLAAYLGGDDFRMYRIEYDEVEAAILRRRGQAFVEHVLARAPLPGLDAHVATHQAVRELHPDIEDVDVLVPASIAEPFLASRELLVEARDEAQLQASILAQFMRTARRGMYGRTARGNLRSIACRMAKSPDSLPYLKPSPLPKPRKEIA